MPNNPNEVLCRVFLKKILNIGLNTAKKNLQKFSLLDYLMNILFKYPVYLFLNLKILEL